MAGSSGADVPVNPLLASLLSGGVSDAAIAFRGYIGPSRTDGCVILYPSLDDLSQSIEISRTDIIGFADLPESALPLGATIIWVKKDATIARRNVQGLRAGNNFGVRSDVRKVGRLRMLVRRPLLQTGDGDCVAPCQSRCNVCRSLCDPCAGVPP